jgi:hypothetical protein
MSGKIERHTTIGHFYTCKIKKNVSDVRKAESATSHLSASDFLCKCCQVSGLRKISATKRPLGGAAEVNEFPAKPLLTIVIAPSAILLTTDAL